MLKKLFQKFDRYDWIIFSMLTMVSLGSVFYLVVVALLVFYFFTLPLPTIVNGLLLCCFYYVVVYSWRKRHFTLQSATVVERFLHHKAGATVDFISFVTFKTIALVGLISILPAFLSTQSFVLFCGQLISGALFGLIAKYQIVFDKMDHFECAYTIDSKNEKIKPNGLFGFNLIIGLMTGFVYFGFLITTFKRNYAEYFNIFSTQVMFNFTMGGFKSEVQHLIR